MRSMILALAGVGGLLLAADASAEDYTIVAGSLTDAASGESQPLTGDLQVRVPGEPFDDTPLYTVDDFELQDQHGETHTLESLVEEGPLVLFFYPKAMTTG